LNGELYRHQEIRARGDTILLRHIRARRADPAPHDDLLHILLNARIEDDGGPLADDQVLSESMQILVAGHETSSNALSWTLYLLSQYPEQLRKTIEELEAVVGRSPLRPNQLLALTITTNVLEEALRLYPPFWMIDRVALADDEAGGVPIPAGTTVIVYIHGAQHAAEYWRTADYFVPERFAGEGKALRNDLHHLPLGAGPRRCVGANYAMFQMIMILNAILQNYRFRLAEKPPVKPQPMIIQRAKDGIWMHFEKAH
jgi:cytochrome P450